MSTKSKKRKARRAHLQPQHSYAGYIPHAGVLMSLMSLNMKANESEDSYVTRILADYQRFCEALALHFQICRAPARFTVLDLLRKRAPSYSREKLETLLTFS